MPPKERPLGEVLDEVEAVKGRSLESWSSSVYVAKQVFDSIVKPTGAPNPEAVKEMAAHQAIVLSAVGEEMSRAAQGLVRVREDLEVRAAYAELQNKVISGWPKPAIAERLFYIGSGFLGAGGVAYAYLGASEVVVYLIFWTVGIACLIGGVLGLYRYDRDRGRYFAEVRSRLR